MLVGLRRQVGRPCPPPQRRSAIFTTGKMHELPPPEYIPRRPIQKILETLPRRRGSQGHVSDRLSARNLDQHGLAGPHQVEPEGAAKRGGAGSGGGNDPESTTHRRYIGDRPPMARPRVPGRGWAPEPRPAMHGRFGESMSLPPRPAPVIVPWEPLAVDVLEMRVARRGRRGLAGTRAPRG